MKLEITMERTQRICKEFEVTDEQYKMLINGLNPFSEEMEEEINGGDCRYDFAVYDENGVVIVDWE